MICRCVSTSRWGIRRLPRLLFERDYSSGVSLQTNTVSPVVDCGGVFTEKRASRRRYSASNTRGRSKHIRDIVTSLRSKNKEDARSSFEALHPRDKLDVLRTLRKRRERKVSSLPTYYNTLFERRYFFQEEDLLEQSTLGRGPGGQATNRRMQTAIVKHVPTDITVKYSKFPSYWLNRRAAREILSLRLEEHWSGADSKLGRRKLLHERRRLRLLHKRLMLAERGGILTAKRTQQHEFYSVLIGKAPFPPPVMMQLPTSFKGRTLFLTDLFEGECGRWWPILSNAFEGVNRSNLIPVVPELLLYVFPAVFFSSPPTSVQLYEWEEVKRCASDDLALRNVRRALRCFVELFGLCLLEKSSVSSPGGQNAKVLRLQTEGLNWMELNRRMLSSREEMTPLALACFSHVMLSLLQLNCSQESDSILNFFKRSAKLSAQGKVGNKYWALQGWTAMQEVLKSNKVTQALTSPRTETSK